MSMVSNSSPARSSLRLAFLLPAAALIAMTARKKPTIKVRGCSEGACIDCEVGRLTRPVENLSNIMNGVDRVLFLLVNLRKQLL